MLSKKLRKGLLRFGERIANGWRGVGLSLASRYQTFRASGSVHASEVRYWLQTGLRKGTYIYDNYLKLFGLEKADLMNKAICDFGCGPYGGIFSVLPAAEAAYPIDILADEFNEWGASPFRIYSVRDYRAELPDQICDICFCTNAIDHVPEPARVTGEIARLLKPGGSLYLHVHLRRPEQLNKVHRYAVTREMVEGWFKRCFWFERIGVDQDWPNDEPNLVMLYSHLIRRSDIT